jgi:Uma2 family endonuclease
LLAPATETGPDRVSYDDFLRQAADTRAEWVDGTVVEMSPANLRHQHIVLFLATTMRTFVEQRGLGVILVAPFQMKLDRSGREPDVVFIATAHLDRLGATYLDGPADLVVEVVSPDSVSRDRGEKYVEYEAAGVPEYWLIDPDRRQAEFYRLDAQGRYQITPPDEVGRYESKLVPGFHLDVDWLWQDPPPPVLDVLRDLGVI